MAEKTFEQELADIENQLGNSAIPESEKAKLRVRKEEILNNPQYRYAKAHGLSTAKTPNAVEIQEANTDYENLADKNIGVLNNTPQAPKENYSDVDDTKAVGATKEELDYMLQNGQISKAAYEKQIAASKIPEVQEEITEGEKKADENEWDSSKRPDDFQLGAKIDPDDSDKDKASKKEYNQSMMSIWDAYHNGLIDKETAGYFTIDALATLAKNLGRSIGNVGAQFSGGTIDQGHDESMWDKRKDKIFNTELQKESEGIDTFENLLKGYQVDKAATVNDMLNDFKTKADDPNLSETERQYYQLLAVELAGAGLDGNTQIAAIGSGVWEDIKSKIDEWRNKGK